MTWIQTYTGKQFFLDDPRPEDICIEDIAHALSHICRYVGHTSNFYSVAEHSILMVDAVYCKEALLHDAAEAYIGDVSYPMKSLLPEIKVLEDIILETIFKKFNLDWPIDPDKKESISNYDKELRIAERNVFLLNIPAPWDHEVQSAKVRIHGYLPYEAKNLFLSRFHELF